MEENKNIKPEQPLENIPEEITPSQEYILPDAETTTTELQQTTNTKLQTEAMEVHHHGHVHEKKKWKEYVFQFLMLFLAVFCGFLAEYQLEHKIEKDRELQFIKSLDFDLQDDVKNLETTIESERQAITKLDTLINFLNIPELAKQNGDQLYYVARVGPRSQPFAINSRTFDQLRYSGGFRLIRNAESSNKIMSYYNQLSHIRLLEDNYNHEFDNYKRIAAKIIDPGILRRQENSNGEIRRSDDNTSLTTYDAGLMKELGFHTLQMNGSRRSKIVLLENLRKTAVDLKSYLQKEYHIENE
jgi:hypothetical protein